MEEYQTNDQGMILEAMEGRKAGEIKDYSKRLEAASDESLWALIMLAQDVLSKRMKQRRR